MYELDPYQKLTASIDDFQSVLRKQITDLERANTCRHLVTSLVNLHVEMSDLKIYIQEHSLDCTAQTLIYMPKLK